MEDRRGMHPAVMGGGVVTLVVVVVGLLFGVDPSALLQMGSQAAPAQQGEAPAPPADDEQAQFVSHILGDTDETWSSIFQQHGASYEPPTLVLFTDAVRSGCGTAPSAVGPFYCPRDHKVYLDLTFFRELSDRFGAPGDFARAYVVAHEVGHHVQTLTSTAAGGEIGGGAGAGGASVRTELQADCYAGIWAHFADSKGIIEPGDIDEGLTAAAAIGDDRLQRQAQGDVTPDSFTHGTSAQRARWFRTGYESGRVDSCDTFAATAL